MEIRFFTVITIENENKLTQPCLLLLQQIKIQSFSLSLSLSLLLQSATMASILFPTTRMRLNTTLSVPAPPPTSPSSRRPSPPTNFLSPFVGGSVCGDFAGLRIRPASLIDNSSNSTSRGKRGVVTMVFYPYFFLNCVYVEITRSALCTLEFDIASIVFQLIFRVRPCISSYE